MNRLCDNYRKMVRADTERVIDAVLLRSDLAEVRRVLEWYAAQLEQSDEMPRRAILHALRGLLSLAEEEGPVSADSLRRLIAGVEKMGPVNPPPTNLLELLR